MSRYRSRAQTDATSPRAWGVCDRCSFAYNLYQLQYQYQFNGSSLYNTRYRVCPTCMDIPQPQLLNPILPPDPLPVNDPRPPAYSVNEAGPTQGLQCQIVSNEIEIGPDFYLDILNNDPNNGGTSILATVSGSATRTNYASVMSAPDAGGRSGNTETITITTEALATAFAAWVAIYDAPTDGNVLFSSPLLVPQSVVLYNGAAFEAGQLVVLLRVPQQYDLSASLTSTAVEIGAFYLDLFDGDPLTTGTSVLSALTGSATRTDYASAMATPTIYQVTENESEISITASADSAASVSYVGIYNAATGGTLLMSAPTSVVNVLQGDAVSFAPGGLIVQLFITGAAQFLIDYGEGMVMDFTDASIAIVGDV